jgi:hypothetical protein
MVRPSAILFVEVNASQQALKRLLTPGGELVRMRWRRRRRRRRRKEEGESEATQALTFSNRFPLSFLHSLCQGLIINLSPRSASVWGCRAPIGTPEVNRGVTRCWWCSVMLAVKRKVMDGRFCVHTSQVRAHYERCHYRHRSQMSEL